MPKIKYLLLANTLFLSKILHEYLKKNIKNCKSACRQSDMKNVHKRTCGVHGKFSENPNYEKNFTSGENCPSYKYLFNVLCLRFSFESKAQFYFSNRTLPNSQHYVMKNDFT